jgi:beta-glucosidase
VILPPFKAAVDAGVASVMSSFNSINGIPATANRRLLTDVLRTEWGFDGFVVSDWSAVAELKNHGIAADDREAARKAIRAGVDLAMTDGTYLKLTTADKEFVDRAASRVLKAKEKAGLFENAMTTEAMPPLDRATARRIAQQTIVLLKNDGVLPLKRTQKIALVGLLAKSREDMLGGWAAEGKAEDAVSVADAIPSVDVAEADVIVAIVGETRHMSGEAASRSSIDLSADEQKVLDAAIATGKPVVTVVLSGRPLTITQGSAIVYAWYLGIEGGNAIADVLFGDVNPSGRLPVTFPRNTGQIPVYYSRLPSGRPGDPEQKFTNKYIDVAIEPLYVFGFGLSYTRFEYRDLRIDGQTVSAEIVNAGDRDGVETVQFYIHDPVASVSRPRKELKGYQRIALKAGERKRVSFTLSSKDLRFWARGGWVFEPGKFNVWIAPDSARGLASSLVISR